MMQLSEIFLGLGEESFSRLVRSISIGRLKTYQLYDTIKTRAHVSKVNTEALRKAAPRFWTRLADNDEELASELSQAILVSHLDMIKKVLDFLEIPHEDGFFSKDLEASAHFAEGWQQRVHEKFRDTYPEPVLIFYINHLGTELGKATELYSAAPVQ